MEKLIIKVIAWILVLRYFCKVKIRELKTRSVNINIESLEDKIDDILNPKPEPNRGYIGDAYGNPSGLGQMSALGGLAGGHGIYLGMSSAMLGLQNSQCESGAARRQHEAMRAAQQNTYENEMRHYQARRKPRGIECKT